ncbi:MAG: DUF1801 domain-containing protein [Gammaproteobacteria bacterium]|jgi:hypothetical protein|nr:DUF1801 domain-containing protein [Gammaproteobacteria bacterium]MDP6536557.1 DUF1801 domain-containing protein [Gammaproteobacteria bacterium]MDP6733063.1 DUF1801 domain-containing protein [Gammaproteobacteria bacterium]HAJ76691.1 DUF1801 domain-containing protein [Gammaproteobacteria bacterium]|tara:strand:+ start:579 stop:989 length:411 start_codon:yes stop_codon:yes gene_type:complete
MTSVKKFIAAVENDTRRNDALALVPIMEEASGYKAELRNKAICFGHYHYKYESGREGGSAVTGFVPRKQSLVVYIMPGFSKYQHLLKDLGKFKTGSSCLYINKLDDIDLKVLKRLVKASVKDMQKKYVCTTKLHKA